MKTNKNLGFIHVLGLPQISSALTWFYCRKMNGLGDKMFEYFILSSFH